MQHISYRYKSPLSSDVFNERFSYVFGDSVLAGFRFEVSSDGHSIDLKRKEFETNLVVTRDGVIIEEDEDIEQAVSFAPNTTEVDRRDAVYLVYDHKDMYSEATYISVSGNYEIGEAPSREENHIYTFLGEVVVPSQQQEISPDLLYPVRVGLSKLEVANEAFFRDGVNVSGMSEFFDRVVFRGDINFISGIVAEMEAAFQANILIPLEPDKDGHAASKFYVDSVATGLSPKRPVRATTTVPVTLYGEITIDQVNVVDGDRVLVKDQSTMEENGIYIVRVEDWERAEDANENDEVYSGIHVFVQEGEKYKDSAWVLITDAPVSLGTTPLEFVQYGGAGESIAGEGLQKDGNELSVLPATAVTLGSFIKGDGVSLTSDGILSLNLGKGLEYQGVSPDRTVNVKFLPTGNNNGSTTTAARSDHLHDDRYYTRNESDAEFWRKDENEKMIRDQNDFSTSATLYESSQKYYRRVDHTRPDDTLYLRSTLSNIDVDGYARTLRLDYYDDNGSTIIETQVWNLTYDEMGQIVEKIKTS